MYPARNAPAKATARLGHLDQSYMFWEPEYTWSMRCLNRWMVYLDYSIKPSLVPWLQTVSSTWSQSTIWETEQSTMLLLRCYMPKSYGAPLNARTWVITVPIMLNGEYHKKVRVWLRARGQNNNAANIIFSHLHIFSHRDTPILWIEAAAEPSLLSTHTGGRRRFGGVCLCCSGAERGSSQVSSKRSSSSSSLVIV